MGVHGLLAENPAEGLLTPGIAEVRLCYLMADLSACRLAMQMLRRLNRASVCARLVRV